MRHALRSSLHLTDFRPRDLYELLFNLLRLAVSTKTWFISKLMQSHFIPLESSFHVLSKVFWVQLDLVTWLAASQSENRTTLLPFYQPELDSFWSKFNQTIHRSIARWMFYRKSFACNSTESRDQPQNRWLPTDSICRALTAIDHEVSASNSTPLSTICVQNQSPVSPIFAEIAEWNK